MRFKRSLASNAIVAIGLLLTTLATTGLRAEDGNAAAGVPESQLPVLNLLKPEPGKFVDNAPPAGWTHLIVKSIPRLASGDLNTLPDSAKATASMFRSVILADVRRVAGPDSDFNLKRVGLGICLPDRGHDLLVDSDSLQALGVKLSTIPKLVLRQAETETAKALLVARTPTFAILRSPVLLAVQGEHRQVLINYALQVDPKSGGLRTIVWWIDVDSKSRKPPRSLVLLKPSPLVFALDMDVDAIRILGEIPVSWTFAMAALPPGQAYTMPSSLQAWTIRDPKNVAESSTFERALREWNPVMPVSSATNGTAARPTEQPR